MTENVTLLVLRVGDADSDPEELARLTSALRHELLDLDVSAVDPASAGPSPAGSRAIEMAALGTLVVTLAKSEVLAALITSVSQWLGNRQRRTVKIEINGDVLELSGLPSTERQRLTHEWLSRHTVVPAPTAAARSALIVASTQYQDPGLRRLRAPGHDAAALARVLGDSAIGAFDVHTLLDAPSYEVCEAIEEFFADRRPDDLLLMHFSGHGVKDEAGELHFATSNTRLRRLGATSIPAEFVNRRMNRSRSRRIVLLLDCCYAGAFERGLTARAGTAVGIEDQFGGGRGRAVITASSAMEYAFEGDQLTDAHELAPSIFTTALVEGLETGEADRDQDGRVGLDELYDYIYDKVRDTTPNQTPGKWTFGVQGDIYLARRARPVNTPATLPNELQTAIDNPIASIRLGAVHELARQLGSGHAGVALAARLALQRLVHDDSRSVSAAATQALAHGPTPAADTPPRPGPAATAPVLPAPPEPQAHPQPAHSQRGSPSLQQTAPIRSATADHQRQIVDTHGRPLSDKRRKVAGLLQVFLGVVGAGRFYTGHIEIAVGQLLLSVVTAGIGGAVWGLVDGISILTRGGVDAKGRTLRP